MKRYLEHMHSKEPHERRRHALQIAGGVTAFAMVVWVTTLGTRFGEMGGAVAEGGQQWDSALSAAAALSQQQGAAALQVSTTSVYQSGTTGY